MTLIELEEALVKARLDGCTDSTPVAVGNRHTHIDVNEITTALFEPRDETGHRITSVRKVFIS
jgi:hypothetical protein